MEEANRSVRKQTLPGLNLIRQHFFSHSECLKQGFFSRKTELGKHSHSCMLLSKREKTVIELSIRSLLDILLVSLWKCHPEGSI